MEILLGSKVLSARKMEIAEIRPFSVDRTGVTGSVVASGSFLWGQQSLKRARSIRRFLGGTVGDLLADPPVDLGDGGAWVLGKVLTDPLSQLVRLGAGQRGVLVQPSGTQDVEGGIEVPGGRCRGRCGPVRRRCGDGWREAGCGA